MSSYILKIEGKRLDTFIMILVRLSISFKEIKRTKDYLIIEVLEEDYNKFLKINTTYNIEIIKRKGLAYFIHFLKFRKLFIIVTILGFLFFNLLTNLVFNVRVVETDNDLRELILSDLKELGIKKYGFKVNYKEKEKIEEKILNKERDLLEWIEIEEKGVNYEVKLIKRVKDNIEKETEPRNIIASKNGLVTRIEAEKGEVVTKKNAYVNKGDILISGLIKNNENIVSKTRAIGKVYAEVWYKVSLSLPTNYHEEKKTGKNKIVLEISFLSDDIAITDFDKYKHSKDTKTVLYKHPLLPISINLTKKEEVVSALIHSPLWTQEGFLTTTASDVFWDRSTLMAIRAMYCAKDSINATKFLLSYSLNRLLTDHVPYAIEAYPEGNQAQLSAESALYIRIFVEGILGFVPHSFSSFYLKPSLCKTLSYIEINHLYLCNKKINIHATLLKDQRVELVLSGDIQQKHTLSNYQQILIELG